MAIVVVFIKSWYIFLIDGNLVDINFLNINKPIKLYNRKDL